MKFFIAFTFLFYSLLTQSQVKSLPADAMASIKQRIQAGTNPGIVVGIIDKDGPQYYSFGKKKTGGKKVKMSSLMMRSLLPIPGLMSLLRDLI